MQLIAFSLFIFTLPLAAAHFVVPGQDGTGASVFPFGDADLRYQQVYDATAFPSLNLVGGGYVTGLWFRVAQGGFGEGVFQLNLSTTTQAVDGLSSTFQNNIGSDDTVVFAQGRYGTLYDLNGPLGGGGILIPLTTPFLYDPRKGNLLLEVRMVTEFGPYLPGRQFTFESAFVQGDATSRLVAFGRDSTTGTPSTLGLITAFSIQPVPEPSSAALLLGMAASFYLCHRKTKHKRLNRKE
jgi:hypothetical protein